MTLQELQNQFKTKNEVDDDVIQLALKAGWDGALLEASRAAIKCETPDEVYFAIHKLMSKA